MYILLSQKHLNVIRGDSFRSEQTAHTSPSRLQSLLLQWNISTSLVYLTVPFCYYKDIFLYWTGLIKDATEYFCISKLLCSIFLYEQWIKVTERGSLHCSVYSLTLPCYMEPVQNPIWYHGGNSVATDQRDKLPLIILKWNVFSLPTCWAWHLRILQYHFNHSFSPLVSCLC